MVWCGVVWCGVAWCGVALCGLVVSDPHLGSSELGNDLVFTTIWAIVWSFLGGSALGLVVAFLQAAHLSCHLSTSPHPPD